jgi:hypothetical protein
LSIPVVSDTGEDANSLVSTSIGSTRQRSVVGRKLRISRSKVICEVGFAADFFC